MRRALAIIMMIVLSIGLLLAQGTPRKTVVELLAQLHSARWSDRAAAHEQLRRDTVAMRQANVRSALLDLLDRENDPAAPQDSDLTAASAESYIEYTSSLLGTVLSFLDPRDSRQLCILAHSPFTPDSKVAAQLAGSGQVILPCLMQMYESAYFPDRYRAIAVMIQIREKVHNLNAETGAEIKRLTITALHDSNESVRGETIVALRAFGGFDMIPALQQVAQSDPAPEIRGSSIRKLAAKAIMAIQQRAGK